MAKKGWYDRRTRGRSHAGPVRARTSCPRARGALRAGPAYHPAVAEDEPGTKKKKARPKGIDEPPLGFGRDIELDVQSSLTRWFRGMLLVVALGIVFGLFGHARADRDPRAQLVMIGGGALLAIGAWMAAVILRNRGRTDLVLRMDHRGLDVPRIALFGPPRLTCGFHELSGAALMHNRNATWIELRPVNGPKAIIPNEWVTPVAPLAELFWRIDLRIALARRHHGKTPRDVLVGTEAMIGLGAPGHRIAGIVVARTGTKRPVVVASVASVDEFFARFAEWPDAKLVVPEESRAASLLASVADTARIV